MFDALENRSHTATTTLEQKPDKSETNLCPSAPFLGVLQTVVS